MIGNDIVDLKIASIESNWQRKGFLEKVFTIEEQDLILRSTNSFKMVWLLWSMKESAYKTHVQQYGGRFFAPKKLQCTLTSDTTGTVKIQENKYSTESNINSDYIATSAISNCFDPVLVDNFRLKNNSYRCQHNNCHSRLKKALGNKMNLPLKELSIKKNSNGVPKLFFKEKEQPIYFSISHHGNYGSNVILN